MAREKPTEDAEAFDPLAGVVSITVVGPAAGRWRAGRLFGSDATVIDRAELSAAAFGSILADPALSVTVQSEPVEPAK